ncbi:hypothetical protein NQZ68_041539 [Dissostichus eleginoides]|nr:hypothetical protein NQZ68_041539 [Dissostichus eleginoides]
MKAGRSSWYGSEENAMNKAEKRKARVTSLVLHLKYASQGLTNSMYVVQEADLPAKEDTAEITEEAPVIQTPKQYPSLTEVPPPDISENNPFHQASIQAPNVGVLGGVLDLDGVPTARRKKELEYEVRILSSEVNQLIEENKRNKEMIEWAATMRDSQFRQEGSEALETSMSFQLKEKLNGRMEELSRRMEEELIRGMEELKRRDEERQRQEHEERKRWEKEQEEKNYRTGYSPETTHSAEEEEEGSQEQETRTVSIAGRLKGPHKTHVTIDSSWKRRIDISTMGTQGHGNTSGKATPTLQGWSELDLRALLGRIEGRPEAREVDSKARCMDEPDDTPLNHIRSKYWTAIRLTYPTKRSFTALSSLKKETGEEMHDFLKRCDEVSMDDTGEHHDKVDGS